MKNIMKYLTKDDNNIENNINPNTRKVAPINVKGIEKYPVSLYIIYVLVAK